MKAIFHAARTGFLAAVLITATGCGSKVVDELEALTDKMCACEQKKCANEMHKQVEAWAERNRASRGRRSDHEKIRELMDKSNGCMTNVLLGKKGEDDKSKPDKQNSKVAPEKKDK